MMTPQSVQQHSHSQNHRQNVNKSGVNRPQTPSSQCREADGCLSQLAKHEDMTNVNMDYMLSLFSEEFKEFNIKVLNSNTIDVMTPHYCIPTESKSFIAPICHKREGNLWSVIYVTCSPASHSSARVVKALHYEPIASDGRDQDVRAKIIWWVQQRLGTDAKLEYDRAVSPII
ncbi:hypothetical protein IL306_013374 [Fusarium sp. DS 682]|nr:hypothetical protein IL306_013374 [Fusarium sp. DS 682]